MHAIGNLTPPHRATPDLRTASVSFNHEQVAPPQPKPFYFIAEQFNLAGGAIINASINACVVAASEGQSLGMRHCVIAIARELYKNGKQINRVHFGEHYDEVKDLF